MPACSPGALEATRLGVGSLAAVLSRGDAGRRAVLNARGAEQQGVQEGWGGTVSAGRVRTAISLCRAGGEGGEMGNERLCSGQGQDHRARGITGGR